MMSHQNPIVSTPDPQSSAAGRVPLPPPRVPIAIRPATMEDLAFIDALQKKNTKQVGFMQTKALEGKIRLGHVLVAEERHEGTQARRHEVGLEGEGISAESALDPSSPGPHFVPTCLRASVPVGRASVPNPIGYLIATDQYFKRDDCGIIYQINIAESHRRSLVGAMLLKAQFERSAYGCRLYCCWCAQDIEANRFWEALGFTALAFRAGSEKKQRIHIFWQKRIRENDTTTPWWFPAETKGGSMMEDRLVFPIPPGTHWSDAKPIVLPRHTRAEAKQIESAAGSMARNIKRVLPRPRSVPLSGGLMFAPVKAEAPNEKPPRQKKPKIKNDPRYVAAARELRDRWLEKVNENPLILGSNGKYEVSRQIEDATTLQPVMTGARLLEAA
jgi:hypothetical protein